MPEQQHVLLIALGPIQDFIMTARRTRDLWFGSYMLSECSKAVAKSILDNQEELIFPNPNKNDLEPDSEMSVVNNIAALIRKKDIIEIAELIRFLLPFKPKYNLALTAQKSKLK
jgi:CRISPR-associated protein Cmr2